MKIMPVSEFRKSNMAKLIKKHRIIVLTRHGKPVCAAMKWDLFEKLGVG